MPEIRIDPLTGLRTIVAPDRGFELGLPDAPAGGVFDDAAVLSPDAPDVEPDAVPDLFAALPARGSHEAIDHGPHAVSHLSDLTVDETRAAVEVWRERMRAHAGAAYVHLCLDEPHPHAQLYALQFVPAIVARERERFGAYAVRTMGGSLLDDLVGEEVRRRERIVAIDDEAVLLCPYASRRPYQLMLAPRRRRARFEDEGPSGAALLHDALSRLRRRFGAPPPLSLWVRTAPRDAERFCWRIDIVPRSARTGGLELGTGMDRNPVSPERAAVELREA